MFHRKLELSSMFGPPERESLHIPESECTPLVIICLERPFHSQFLARSKQKGVEQKFLGNGTPTSIILIATNRGRKRE